MMFTVKNKIQFAVKVHLRHFCHRALVKANKFLESLAEIYLTSSYTDASCILHFDISILISG